MIPKHIKIIYVVVAVLVFLSSISIALYWFIPPATREFFDHVLIVLSGWTSAAAVYLSLYLYAKLGKYGMFTEIGNTLEQKAEKVEKPKNNFDKAEEENGEN